MLLLLYEEKDEAFATGLRDFVKTLGVEKMFLAAWEPSLSADEFSTRYFGKCEAALILASAGSASPLSIFADVNSLHGKILIKHFGMNSGKTLWLGEDELKSPQGAVAALTKTSKWVQSSGLLEKSEDEKAADPAVSAVFAGLDKTLRAVALELNAQDKQQMALELFFQVMQAKHGKNAEESRGIVKKLAEASLVEESQVLGKKYLKLTRKGREIAAMESKNRPKDVFRSVFKS